MIAPILEITDLKKRYRSQWTFLGRDALKGISLSINRGESFGFLGPNGAGKTTTIKCALGLISPTSGKILFNGRSLNNPAARSQIGFLPEQPYFYEHLTVEETLQFFASLFSQKRVKQQEAVRRSLELLNLTSLGKNPVRTLSKGQQQRLGFAQAIINDPDLLILDEPFSGLDPLGRADLKQLVLELNREGKTVFLSSHILSDVEDICSRVSIMSSGRLRTIFNLEEMGRIFGETYEITYQKNNTEDALPNAIKSKAAEITEIDAIGDKRFRLVFKSYSDATDALQLLLRTNSVILSFKNAAPRLEDVFIRVAKNEQGAENDV